MTFSNEKNVSVYLEVDVQSDKSFDDIVKQMGMPKGFPAKIKFCTILKRTSIQD